MSRMHRMRYALGAAVAAALLFMCGEAQAQQTVIGADLSYAAPFEDEANTGYGVGLRFGQRVGLGVASLTGELVGDYHGFGGAMDPNVVRGMLGARFGFGGLLSPHVFAHGGIGRLGGNEIAGVSPTRTAFSYDLGGGLDITLLPLINVGAHVAYNRIAGNDDVDGFDWLSTGLHVELLF
jgi:opacity protein-like surface antigen